MPPFLPLPCHLVDEFTLRMVVEQCVCDVVNEEETSSSKHSHGNSIAPVPPTRLPASPMQAVSHGQPFDEPLLPVKIALGQQDLLIINKGGSTGVTCSLTTETVRKQSKYIKTSMMEYGGRYLSQAAAYIQERISSRSPNCDVFILRAQEELPVKLTNLKARWQELHAITIHMPKPASSPQANPSPSVSAEQLAQQQHLFKFIQFPHDEPNCQVARGSPPDLIGGYGGPDFPSTSVSPDNSNNLGWELIDEIENKAHHYTIGLINEENGVNMRCSPEPELGRANTLSFPHPEVIGHQPDPDTSLHIVEIQGDKGMLLVETAVALGHLYEYRPNDKELTGQIHWRSLPSPTHSLRSP